MTWLRFFACALCAIPLAVVLTLLGKVLGVISVPLESGYAVALGLVSLVCFSLFAAMQYFEFKQQGVAVNQPQLQGRPSVVGRANNMAHPQSFSAKAWSLLNALFGALLRGASWIASGVKRLVSGIGNQAAAHGPKAVIHGKKAGAYIAANIALSAAWAFIALALLSAIGSALEWWSMWKGLHFFALFAGLAVCFFIESYGKTKEYWKHVMENKALTLLIISVIVITANISHGKLETLSTIVFFVLAIIALITVFGGWGQVGSGFAWVYLNKNNKEASVLAWSISTAIVLSIFVLLMKMNGARINSVTESIIVVIYLISLTTGGVSAKRLLSGEKNGA